MLRSWEPRHARGASGAESYAGAAAAKPSQTPIHVLSWLIDR